MNRSSPERPSQLDSPPSTGVPLKRSNTGPGLSRPKATALNRSTTNTGARSQSPQQHRYSGHFGSHAGAWNEIAETSSNSLNEDDEDVLDVDDQEWGLHKGMELFEVSSKDDIGIGNLFESLISAIITKKDIIERENELKKRDSVFLSSVSTPTWATQADEEDSPPKAHSAISWVCCAT